MSKFQELLTALKAQPLRTLVRVQRADDLDRTLKRDHGIPLDQSLLDEAKLVTNREEMLRRFPKGGRVAEIGVAAGTFSRLILDICEPDELHLIDPWFDEAQFDYSDASFSNVQKRFSKEIESGQVIMHRAMSMDVLPSFSDDFLDWIYVDGAHDYQSVADEMVAAARVVKDGGMIAGHDYIRWVSPTIRFGVMEAVNEFATKTGSPFAYLTNQFDKHDSFAVTVRKSG